MSLTINMQRSLWVILILLFTVQSVSASYSHWPEDRHQSSIEHPCSESDKSANSVHKADHKHYTHTIDCENCIYHFQLSLLIALDFGFQNHSHLTQALSENTFIPSAPFYHLYRPPIFI